MTYDRLQLAKALSLTAHADVTDKAGKPYYLHPLYVSEHVFTEDEKIVALLHEVLEDSLITPEYICYQFGDHILEAISAMTRKKRETYEEFIQRVARNPIARVVKIEDIKYNMDLTRLPEIRKKDLRRNEKYQKALEYLLSQGEKECTDK